MKARRAMVATLCEAAAARKRAELQRAVDLENAPGCPECGGLMAWRGGDRGGWRLTCKCQGATIHRTPARRGAGKVRP